VLIAAAACEMHPAAVLRALQMSSVAQELRRTTLRAARSGVREVPAVLVGDGADGRVGEEGGEQRVFHGEHALGEAAAFMAARAAAVAGGHT
jgi:predicted DsbA family dithiol-disulfide isomerase